MQPWGWISFYHHLCDYFLACLSKVTNLCSSVGNALACRAQCWGLIRGVLLASDKKGDWETRPLFRFAWFSDLANRTPETVRQTQPSSPGEITVMAALVKDDSSAGVANIAHTYVLCEVHQTMGTMCPGIVMHYRTLGWAKLSLVLSTPCGITHRLWTFWNVTAPINQSWSWNNSHHHVILLAVRRFFFQWKPSCT